MREEKKMSEKKKQGRGRIHKIILVILVCVMLASGLWVLGDYVRDWKAQREYEKLAQLVKEETTAAAEETTDREEETEGTEESIEETEPPYVSPINFEELAEINPDVVGWIKIPGTNVNYPIVQAADNDMYLHKSFEGEETAAGSIFLDFESQSDMRGYNSILYGHNMRNGSMFKDIVRYKEEEYFKEHQYFEIYTPTETIHLKAVSCYYIKNDPMVRKTRFKTDESFQAFVQAMLKPCEYAQIPEEPVKNLYTLVTCSYEVDDGRTVLFAVEADEKE